MNAALLGALITQIGLPEFLNWLRSRRGAPITDADILAKLGVDADTGIEVGEAWLASHPGDPAQ